MPTLQNNIETLQSHLLFHRRKVQQYFLFLCALVLLSFGTATAFKLISTSATISLAAEISKASHTPLSLKEKGSNTQPMPIPIEVNSLSALDEKSTENIEFRSEYVYAITVALLVFAILGLIRHHLRRVSIAEDRLFHIEKINSILSTDKPFDPMLASAILGNIATGNDNTSFEPSLIPSQEILERSINALSDISKIVTKRIK